jgi:hypothetical protein
VFKIRQEKKLWNISNKSLVTIKASLVIAVLIGLVIFIASTVTIFAEEPKNIYFAVSDSNGNTLQNAKVEIFVSDALDGEYVSENYAMTGSDGRALISTSSLNKYAYFVVSKVGYDAKWPDENLGQYSTNLDGYVILVSSIDNSADINMILDTFPSIWTRRWNYNPEQVVDIYGAGFDFDKYTNVQIKVTNPNGDVSTWTVPVDSAGEITTTYPLDGIQDIYTIGAFAEDGMTLLASTTFKDDSDPTVFFNSSNGNPIHDTYVQFGEPNSTHNNDDLHVKWDSGDNNKRRTYIKFNISSIPSSATINSAVLHLYQFSAYKGGNLNVSKVSNNYSSNSTPWTEGGLTYTNSPKDFSIGTTTSVDNSDGGKSLSVLTSDVQNALSSGILSLAVKMAPESGSYHHDFYDREYGTASRRPYLEITYTVPVCGNGIIESGEDCDPGANNPNDCCSATCKFESNTYTCSAATGDCDIAEQCTGSSATCPTDQIQPNTYICRQPAGVCDVTEYCDGSSKVCPADAKSTAQCRASAGDCDLAEVCDGINNNCPTDSFKSSSVECRLAADLCDIAEYCTGSGPTCPANGYQSSGTDCGICASCDGQGTCNADLTQHNDCVFCQKCTAKDTCGHQSSSEDIKNECPSGQCVTGYCDGTGACDVHPLSTPCEADQFFCTVDHCDGSGNCVYWKDYNCSANDLSGIATCDNNPDNYNLTWDFRNVFTSVCDDIDDVCPRGDATITYTCSVDSCQAECDATHLCDNKCVSNVFYSDGQCQGNCTCYYSQQNCDDQIACTIDSCDPVTGCSHTPDNSLCDDKDPCTIDVCDVNRGCVNTFSDTVGPTTSGTTVNPVFNNGNFNVTALANDTCSNIKKSEYFLGHSSIGFCGIPGTGASMDATDGLFDELIEALKKDNVLYNVFDGLNWICIQSQDNATNWGNCDCAYFDTDTLPPDCSYDIYLDQTLYPKEYLICGNNAWLNATVCDEQSNIQGGEYFVDFNFTNAVPAPWSGTWMNVLYEFDRPSDGHHCAILGALVNTSNLSDGTHYIKLRGKDTVENWGKIIQCKNVSFIKDTKPPITNKTLIPAEKKQHTCEAGEITGANLPVNVSLTDGCQFVKTGTQIVLHARDQDTPDHEFADKVRIHWVVWYKINPTDPWVVNQSGVGGEEQDVTITLNSDSYHLIEYWAVDSCGWEETHHFELDIVDSKPPILIKDIGEPKVPVSSGEWYINQSTTITLNCVDDNPHPSDHVTVYYRYNVDGGSYTDWITYETPFHFTEDSFHVLEYKCVDILDNTVGPYIETDHVDTVPPTTIKTYGTPLVTTNGGYPKWINSSTSITLTATDGGAICHIGVNKTYWRNTIVDDRYCLSDYDCQMDAQGSGTFTEYIGQFTKPTESCHLIEYYSVDFLGNAEPVKKQCVYVENTPPVSNKTLGTTKHECDSTEKSTYGINDCWYLTNETKLELSCSDLGNHPVDNVTIHYKVEWKENWGDSWQTVKEETVGNYKLFYYEDLDTQYQDSYHKLTWYCVDALGNKEQTHTELDMVDTKPPISNKTLGDPKHVCTPEEQTMYYPALPNPTNGCYFINQSTPITITCSDQNPHPVDHIKIYYRYNVDDGTWTSWTLYNTPFNYSEDSKHTLEWYCVDELGNTETTHVEYDIVDTQAPVTSKTIGNPKLPGDGLTWITNQTQITLNCTDNDPHPVDHVEIKYRYNVDGGDWTQWMTYINPINFGEDSVHTLEYYCADALNNTETIQTEIDKVDSTPPYIIKNIEGPSFGNCLPRGSSDVCFIDGVTNITVNMIDPDPTGRSCNVGGVQCEWGYYLDDNHTQFYGWYSNFPINFPEETKHELHIRCKDALNNSMPEDVEVFYVDKTPPSITKTYGTPYYAENEKEWINSSTSVTLTIVDTGPHKSGIKETKYRVTGVADSFCANNTICQSATGSGSWIDYITPFTITEDSCHLIEYYAKDNVDKTDGIHKQCVYVDNKAPNSIKTFDGINISCSQLPCANESVCDYYITQNTKIVLSCSDQNPHPVDHIKIYYRYNVDDGTWTSWTLYNTSFNYSEDSKHTLEWYCVDELGNTETTHTQIERVDTTPPVTTKIVGDQKWGINDYWVTSNTPITLTTVDKEVPCASGHTTLYYEDWYASNCDDVVDNLVNSGTVYADQDCKLETTIKLNGECLHTLKWYAVDELGNTEQIHTQDHRVDDTPPHVLILKPVDGWYSDGEDIPIVSIAEDLDGRNSPCGHDCDPLGKECAVGIEDGTQCYAYLLDILPEPRIVQLNAEGTFLYNNESHECQGYATIPQKSGIPDGVTILVVRAKDNLGNEAGSLAEILRAVFERCGCDVYDLCAPKCVDDVMQDIITIWNLPKIGIDNHAPEVNITDPLEGTLFGGEQVYFSADVIDSNDGDVTSTITSGTPCYITIGGISLGTVPYNNENRKCTGTIMIPQDTDFPQGTQELKVEIADNAGNLGSDTVNVNVDTVAPTLSIDAPSNNQFVKGMQSIIVEVYDTNLNESLIKVSTDNGQTWHDAYSCDSSEYCYDWNTSQETDGMAYGVIAKATDLVDNTGYSEVVIVIVDNGAPEGVYVVDPIKNDIVEGNITLKALATDYVSGVESVKIYVETEVWNCDATLTGGTWQCEFNSTPMADGNHEVYAVAKDHLGQETTSARVPFIIDNNVPSAPVISVTDPDLDGYDTDGTVTWSWTESTDAGSGIAYYEFMASDKPGDVVTKVLGNFFTTSDLIDGNYTAKVRAVDKAGHASEWSNEVSIKIDTIAPSALTIYGNNIEKSPYDTNGNYDIGWNGGTDTNFDHYELFENDVSIYNGSSTSQTFSGKSDGTYKYQVKSYDKAGHQTVSSFFDVFVDIIAPVITNGTQQSAYPLGWFVPFTVTETGSGIDTISYSTDALLPPICMFNMNTGEGYCYMIGGGNYLNVTVKDKAGWLAKKTINRVANTDFTPPELLTSGPSGVITYNAVTLTATTNESATCKFGTEDNYTTMTIMDGSGTTSHSANLGILTDGYKVYHVKCEDMMGNKMEHSKTIVFYIDTTGNYNLTIPDYGHYWSVGWNTFFLPKIMLDDICGVENGGPYNVTDVLSSLDGENKSFDMIWYFNGEEWLWYDPTFSEYQLLTEFNDEQSLPYYIRMIREDRLEITQDICQLV